VAGVAVGSGSSSAQKSLTDCPVSSAASCSFLKATEFESALPFSSLPLPAKKALHRPFFSGPLRSGPTGVVLPDWSPRGTVIPNLESATETAS